jgi:hypothetical protein
MSSAVIGGLPWKGGPAHSALFRKQPEHVQPAEEQPGDVGQSDTNGC